MLIKKLFNSGTIIAAWVGLLISIMPYVIDVFHPKIAKLIVTPITVDFNKLNFAISNRKKGFRSTYIVSNIVNQAEPKSPLGRAMNTLAPKF